MTFCNFNRITYGRKNKIDINKYSRILTLYKKLLNMVL